VAAALHSAALVRAPPGRLAVFVASVLGLAGIAALFFAVIFVTTLFVPLVLLPLVLIPEPPLALVPIVGTVMLAAVSAPAPPRELLTAAAGPFGGLGLGLSTSGLRLEVPDEG
jgi:hypothetical protein